MKQIDYLRKSRKNCSALLMACALTFMLLTTTLSFAQTNSLTLGCPTRNGSDYSYSNLDLNAGDGVVRSISISFSDDPEGCSIDLPVTPSGWSIASSNDYSKYITLPEGVSATDIENYLRLVSFSVPNNTIRSVSIIMQTNISGNVIYYSDNGHYYQYVPFTNNERTWTWIDCYNAAKGMEYCGRQGYLATLTTLDEDKFVTRLVSTPMWVGGTRLSPTDNDTSTGTQYYASFDTGDEPNADDTDYWYWACGPEKGMQITPGVANPYQDESQHNNAVTWWNTMGAYSNWMYIHRGWNDEHEPNNNLGNGGESCLVILSLRSRNSEEGHTPGFGWADIGYDVNAIGNGDSYGFDPDGYLVEYGDQAIGDSQPQENECSISASGLVGNATHTVRATLSGGTAVCAGEEATLNIIFEDGAFPFTGSVQGNNGEVVHTFNTNDISYNFTVAPNETTSYTISTFSDASSTTGSNGCSGVYNIIYETLGSATVTVNTPQVALTDIAPVAICAGASTTLTATTETATGEVSYAWSTGATGSEITVTPTSTTTYTVTATATQGGCTATATKSVTVMVNNPQVALNDIASVAICAGASTTLTAELDGTPTGDVSYAWSIGATENEITVTPSETTTYTVTATATQGGCTATATKSVTVTVNNPQVALNDIASVAICAGASTTLTAELDGTPTGDVSYAWSTGATENEITVTPSETTTYTVTATANYNGCTATATKEVTVTVNELPTATVSVTNVKCNGAGDGIITVNANGGSGSYQYQLGTGVFQDSSVFTGLNAGSYTLTVKDGNSCTTTTTTTIGEPTQLTLTSVSATDETCKENNDGTIAYTVGGGTPNYTVTFAEGISATKSAAGTYTQSDLSAGDYVVKVVDHNGCSVTAPAVTIDEPATLVINQEGDIKSAQCKGDNNGQFAFSIAGGNGTNTITINGGAVTLATPSEGVYTQTGLAAGTYIVSVTDNKDCSATKNFVVGEPAEVLSATVTSTQESCTGNDGTATVEAAGGNGGYTFAWSNVQSSATATDLSSFINGGVYTVTVTDAEGCTNVQSVTITLNNPLAMAPITGPAVCTGTEFSITPQDGINGTIPAGTTYSWPAPDAISGIGGLEAGTNENRIHGVLTNINNTPQTVSYVVTPKNGVCVGNAVGVSVTVTTTVNPNVTIDMPNAMTVCSNAEIFNLSAIFVNSVSNSTVVWKKDGIIMKTHTVTDSTDSYAIDLANDTCKGEYKYRVEYTDESGCTASDECVITVNAGDWSISQPEGTATIECVSDTTEPAESLLPVVEDGCGRTTTRTFLSRESSPTEITCAGTVTYTYRYTACDDTYKDWTYTYTISDVTDPTIAADAITTKAANIDQTACKFSIPDLTADIRAKASDNCTEAAYLVITQEPAAGIVITAATDVDVTVTDKCGNSTTHTVNVTVPTLPTATIAPTHILCHGNTTGSATVTPTSGTAPYTYLWSNSQTNATATDLDNTEYTVTVTDANGCTTTASVTITEPEALSATTDTVPVDCHGNSTGSATITVTGGIPSYSVTVNGVTKSGNSALTFENLPDGTYPVTIKDANNCELTGVSVTITEPEVLAISAELTQVKCKDGSNGAIDLTVTGGNGSYQYVWNNDSTTQDLTNLTAGEYNVTVKDAKNCSISGTYTIVEPALLQISSITPTNITCPSGEDGEIEVAVTGGTTPYSYQLNGGDAQSSAIFETLIAGNYTVTVTDANGCSTTSSTTLTQPTPLALTGCPTNITKNTDEGKSYATVTWTEPTFSPIGNDATLNVTGDTATNRYSVGTTTITYTVTNTCGESQSCSFTITVSDNQAPEITCEVTVNQDVVPNSAGNTYTHSGNSWDATATDNVAVTSLTYTLTGATDDDTPKTTLDGQVFNYGTTTVTWKATDNTGASDECSFQVVVADNTKPELACPTIATVYECLAEVPAAYANYAAFKAAGGTATDNHQIDESSLTVTATVETGCPTTITRTYSIKDMTGNTGTCTQVITVEDKTAPALKSGSTLPAGESNMSLCFDSIPAGPTVADIKALYEDNCGGEVIVSKSGEPTGNDCGWSVTYTYVIKDTCENETTASVSYSGKAADFTMPANAGTTIHCASDLAAPTLPEVKDACDNVLAPIGDPVISDTPDCDGTVTYTYTYEDCANHSHNWVYTYTIEHEDFTMPANGSSTVTCASEIVAPTLPEVKDACDNVLAPIGDPVISDTPDCDGTVTYTYTYEDCANHSHNWVYTYTIEHEDFTMPANAGTTIHCASDLAAPTLPVVKDACGDTLTGVLKSGYPTATPSCEGDVVYVYTFTDCAGHKHDWTYTYTIEREDFEMPDNDSSTVACASAIEEPTLPVVKDACGDTLTGVLKSGYPTATPACEGDVVYVYTFTDCEGNTHDWTYTYTIEREDFSVPADGSSTVACASAIAAPTLPTVKDNCGNALTGVLKSGYPTATPECEGDVVYVYTFTDCEGNSHDWTYTYTIEYEDFEMPADGSKTVACASEISAPALPTVTDNCGTALTGVLKSGYPTATPSCEGNVVYVYTFTDCAGHKHDWTYTYTIEREDFEMPDNDSSTVACASAIEEPTLPVVKDACGDTLTGVLKSGYPTEAPSCEGTVEYVYTFTDCEGNTHDWTYTYTIEREDFEMPANTGSTVACIDDATVPTAPSVTDNCGNALTPSAAVEGGTYDGCEGTRTYTFTYTDCEGNSHDWVYTYTIERNDFTMPDNAGTTVACASEIVAPTLPEVEDACGNALTGVLKEGYPTETPACEGDVVYIYTFTDCEGNTHDWTYTYTISAPTLTFSGSINDVENVNACYSEEHKAQLLTADQVKAMYTSSCSREITVEISDNVESDNDCNWKITRTYNISDGGCNTDSLTMSVSGSDRTAPAIGTDDLDRTLTATNCVFTIPDMREIVRNISTDCSEITVTQPSAGMEVYPMVAERDTTVNVIVTDSCGNSSVKEVVITIPAKVTISATATPATICYGATSQLTATPANVVGTATYNWTPSDGLNNATIANPVATLTTTTTYTVEVTDGNGCAATATTTVNVNPEVVMDAVDPMTLCVGDVTSYSFTTPLTVGTMSYAWTNSNTAIGLAASGDGNILSFTPTNTTNAPINATITVTPSHTYNDITCVGDPINFTITVRPSIKTPGNVEFACPADTTVVLSYSDCEQLVNIGEPEFENHMSGMTVNITNDAPEGNIFPEGTTVVTWTATDECGDTLTCTQNVVIQFPPCGDTIADFDGYRYSTVRIGCQCWTGENARSEHYSDGTPVDNFRYYNDSDSLENIYGKLYTWYTAVRVPEGDNNAEPSGTTDPFGTTYVQGICPEGWALPTVNEYMQMIANSGDATHAKDGSNLYWLPGYEGQPPFSGFDAYGAGKYNGAIDRYQELLGKTYFWTTLSGSGSETATTVEINYYCAEGLQTELSKGDGVSIRCIRKR